MSRTLLSEPQATDSLPPVPAGPVRPEKNYVQSVEKAFRVIEAFTAEEPLLRLSEVARRAGIDNATAFRLLNTLERLGYVRKSPESRMFQLTLKCLDLGFQAIARLDLRARARPILRALVDKVNDAASLGVLDGLNATYIERIQPKMHGMGIQRQIGQCLPAYCSALGRAILAFLPEKECQRLLEASNRIKYTQRTITELSDLHASLEEVRRRGFVVCDQETVEGIRALAAPVFDADNLPVAAVSVGSSTLRMSLEEFVTLASTPVAQAARELSRGIRASGGVSIAATDASTSGGPRTPPKGQRP
jgi:IclR family transcriptional regulator, pca regulon regulatory protein